MPQCEYAGPSGNRCSNDVLEDSPFCFWHDRNASKKGEDVKKQLEQKARNQESMEGYELGQADLHDVYLIEADLTHANLSRADLSEGHLFGIKLKGARLFKSNLANANLKQGDLEGSDLLGANLDGADLERASFGPRSLLRNHQEAENLVAHGDHIGARAKYLEAEEIYRSIRKAYESAGTTDVAGDFFYWEMVTKRKQLAKFSFIRFWSKLVDILCGYGELPYRVIGSALTFIFVNAFAFCLLGMQHGDKVYAFSLSAGFWEDLATFGYALYFSVVTFTTLGYGDFSPIGWARPFAAIEAMGGVFMSSLFMLTFIRKMTR